MSAVPSSASAREMQLPLGRLRLECAKPGFFDVAVLDTLAYDCLPGSKEFVISLDKCVSAEAPLGYRRAMFTRGIYLGHNVGPPGDVCTTSNGIVVKLASGDASAYRSVLWSYGVKAYLSIVASLERILHVKATTLLNTDGHALLLVGRGGGGKSTLGSHLTDLGFRMVGNTHALVKDGHVWAINSWRRVRQGIKNVYLPPLPKTSVGNGPLSGLIIVDHNRQDRFVCKQVRPEQALSYCMQFVAAIGAYDLKEDLIDVWSDWDTALQKLDSEKELMRELLETHPIYYLSADISCATSRSAAIEFVVGLL